MKCLTCYYATHLVYMQHEWMSHHFIVAVYSILEKFQSNFFVHFFLCVNWLGLIAIFSNTSFSILVLNYIMLSVFVICLLSVIIFRNGKCAVYLNSRQFYLEKKFETKNISKQIWTFDFVTAFSFLVTSILGFFFLFKNIDIYFRFMYKCNVCSVDFQICWCSLEFIHIYIRYICTCTSLFWYISGLILKTLKCTLLQSTCTCMTINSLFFFFGI